MDSLITPAAEKVAMQTADTFVVTTYWQDVLPTSAKVWSAETFAHLSDALDFYHAVEAGEYRRISGVGYVVAFKDGKPIGPLDTQLVGSMVAEGNRSAAADRKHAGLWGKAGGL